MGDVESSDWSIMKAHQEELMLEHEMQQWRIELGESRRGRCLLQDCHPANVRDNFDSASSSASTAELVQTAIVDFSKGEVPPIGKPIGSFRDQAPLFADIFSADTDTSPAMGNSRLISPDVEHCNLKHGRGTVSTCPALAPLPLLTVQPARSIDPGRPRSPIHRRH